jgi:Family of unknown function (DUF5677)
MEEFNNITAKYQPAYIDEGLSSLEKLKQFAFTFYGDVAELYDCLTRLKNVHRNPSGFSLDDAPILGLLVRIAKLLKEVVAYYEKDNAEVIGILERPIIEAATVATFLMRHGPEVMLDYRKCSYKDRLRILRDLEAGSAFYDTKPGKRLLRSVREKMTFEGFSQDDFSEQKKNKWRLQGKTFYDIFAEIQHADLYAATYGMMSESIHGSWNETLDWCLTRASDGTYRPHLFPYPADVRFMAPTILFTNTPFRLWAERINVYDENARRLLDWIEKMNTTLYRAFDSMFDE